VATNTCGCLPNRTHWVYKCPLTTSSRLRTMVLGLFATLALAIAVTGLYGVTDYAVSRRAREIGIRMALGGQRSHILLFIMRHCLLIIGSGLALGLSGASLAGANRTIAQAGK